MTLVRMLAFHLGSSKPGTMKNRNATPTARPEGRSIPEVPEKTSHPDSAVDSRPADRSDESPGVSSAESPAQSAPMSALQVPATGEDFNQLLENDHWHRWIERAGLNAIQKEILMNAVPKSVSGNTIHLILNESSRYLCNEDKVKQIEAHFREKLGLDIHLNMAIRDLSREDSRIETPTQSIARKKQQDKDHARQQFIQDSNVQELVDLFDAEIVGDSIQPA